MTENIEKQSGIHSNEVFQTDKDKSVADQYAEFHKLDYSKCASDKVIDVNKRGRVKTYEV